MYLLVISVAASVYMLIASQVFISFFHLILIFDSKQMMPYDSSVLCGQNFQEEKITHQYVHMYHLIRSEVTSFYSQSIKFQMSQYTVTLVTCTMNNPGHLKMHPYATLSFVSNVQH